jgi:hypothetical protein
MDDQPSKCDTVLEPEHLYDHTVPRHPRLGIALVCSLIVLGGGQVVRREYWRAVNLWVIAIFGTGAVMAVFATIHPHTDPGRLFGAEWSMVYALVKTAGIFDALRPDKRRPVEPALVTV